MSDFQAIADRVEIEELRGEFTDAAMMRDRARLASLPIPAPLFADPAPAQRLERAAAALTAHGFTVEILDDAAAARTRIKDLIPEDASVFTGASETLRLSGIEEDINNSGRYEAIRPRGLAMDRATQMDEIRRLLASSDVIVGSVAALTETGSLVIASASGSQLPGYAGGAARAIWIVGAQKVVPDLPAALRRVEDHCLSLESARAQAAYGSPSAINRLLMGVTLDGFVHGAKGYEDWGLPPEEDEVVAWKVASLREAGTHIMGRATYEAMASVWPNTTGVYADVMNEIPKVVFSKTLTRAGWAESRIADGGLAEDIDRLKGEPGGLILAHGGATFVDALIHDGLIDEYRLVIHPVAIGHGTGLFSALREPLRLDLIEARQFAGGTAIHVYRPGEGNR